MIFKQMIKQIVPVA